MTDVLKRLEHAQLQYHFGDAAIMQRHAKVENWKIAIGTQSYSVVVVPPCDCLAENTVKILKEFKAQGGLIIFTDSFRKIALNYAGDHFNEPFAPITALNASSAEQAGHRATST